MGIYGYVKMCGLETAATVTASLAVSALSVTAARVCILFNNAVRDFCEKIYLAEGSRLLIDFLPESVASKIKSIGSFSNQNITLTSSAPYKELGLNLAKSAVAASILFVAARYIGRNSLVVNTVAGLASRSVNWILARV